MSEPPAAWHPPQFDAKSRLPASRRGADEALARALEDSRAEGYAQGLAEGRAAGEQEAAELVSRMQTLWQSMASPYRLQTDRLASELEALVSELVTAVVREAASSVPGLIENIVPEVLEHLANLSEPVELILNPADREYLAALMPAASGAVRLREDPAISPGGCQVEAPGWFLDATIERRIADSLRRTLEASPRRQAGATVDGEGE